MALKTVVLSFRATVERDGKVHLLWGGRDRKEPRRSYHIAPSSWEQGGLLGDGISALWLNKQTV